MSTSEQQEKQSEDERVTSELFIDAVLCPAKGRHVGASKELPEDLSSVTVPPIEASVLVHEYDSLKSRVNQTGEMTQQDAEDLDLDPRLQIRIIPQLLREVITHTQARQILHLRLFADTLPDFLEYCDDTTHEEWIMLLALLFTFTNRRDGLTHLQKKNNEDISDCCFLMLYRLLSETHAQTVAVHVAMKEVLERLELTEEMINGKVSTLMYDTLSTPEGFGTVDTSQLPDPADVVTSSSDEEESEEEDENDFSSSTARFASSGRLASSGRASSPGSPKAGSPKAKGGTVNFSTSKPAKKTLKSPTAPLAPLPYDPYYHSIDSLQPENRGHCITERDFLSLEHWYHTEVAKSSEGKLLVTLAIQRSPPAGRVFVASAMKAWIAEHPSGEASLTDLLQFLFPDCPQRTILKRVAGQPLLDPGQATSSKTPVGDTDSGTPPLPPAGAGLVPVFRAPAPVSAAYEVMAFHHLGTATLAKKEYISALHDWFTALDFRSAGKLERKQVEPFIEESPFMHGKKVPNSFDFAALVQLVLGEEGGAKRGDQKSTKKIREITAELDKSVKKRNEKQLKFCKTDNESFEQALMSTQSTSPAPPASPEKPEKRSTSPMSPTKPATPNQPSAFSPSSSVRESPQPTSACAAFGLMPLQTSEDGRLISSLSAEQVTHLRFINDKLLTEYLHEKKRVKKIARKEVRKVEATQRRQQGIDTQLKEQEDYSRLNVPTVYGPFFPQQCFIVAGMKVTPSTLQLDAFLDQEQGWKPLAVTMLRRLDLVGIGPKIFIKSAAKFPLHTLFPEQNFSAGNKVYRDFAMCSRREPSKGYWEGDQHLHLKTNIPTNSDIKYRIQLEGYNFGTNAPISSVCVGYAARMLEHIDCMESYGWPDGWDAFSILHYGKGLSKIVQYVSEDGFVTLRCEAKSLQAVGFSVSAWLVTPDFGNGFAIGAKIYHQQDDL